MVISNEQCSLSMHAHALELLKETLKPGCRALDIGSGSGSGYLTVCMALMVGPSGKVVGLDHIPELVELGKKNMRMDGHARLWPNLDGRDGWEREAPYDCIHVGAAAATLPQALVQQLKPGGKMIIPLGPEGGKQTLDLVEKDNENRVTKTKLMGVRYVPLCEKKYQLNKMK